MHSLEEIPSINEKVKVTGCFPLIETVTELTFMDIGSLSCNAPAQITTEKKEGGGLRDVRCFLRSHTCDPPTPYFLTTHSQISPSLFDRLSLFSSIFFFFFFFIYFYFFIFFTQYKHISLTLPHSHQHLHFSSPSPSFPCKIAGKLHRKMVRLTHLYYLK